MRCMHPLAVVLDGKRQFVPCGKCNFCLEARRQDWAFRLRQELKVSSSSYFLTLTYSDENLHLNSRGVSTLSKPDLVRCHKRIRKAQSKITTDRVRFYAVGEYGTNTGRAHYHSIMFNLHDKVLTRLESLWGLGMVYVGTVTAASIMYVAKYHVNAVGDFSDRAPPFCIMSRKPGIGSNYVGTHAAWHLGGMRNYTQVNGEMGRLPRYYKEKIFKDEEGEWKVDPEELLGDRSERQEYFAEIDRLSKLVESPHEYFLERKRENHDAVVHKSNKLNRF